MDTYLVKLYYPHGWVEISEEGIAFRGNNVTHALIFPNIATFSQLEDLVREKLQIREGLEFSIFYMAPRDEIVS